jgi:pheromone shutdown protein TraB
MQEMGVEIACDQKSAVETARQLSIPIALIDR